MTAANPKGDEPPPLLLSVIVALAAMWLTYILIPLYT